MPGAGSISSVSRHHYSPFSQRKGAANLRAPQLSEQLPFSRLSGSYQKSIKPPLIHGELEVVNLHCTELNFPSGAVSMTKPAPTEPIGSIRRPVDLIERVAKGDSEDLTSLLSMK